jgi:hypothetical protein
VVRCRHWWCGHHDDAVLIRTLVIAEPGQLRDSPGQLPIRPQGKGIGDAKG